MTQEYSYSTDYSLNLLTILKIIRTIVKNSNRLIQCMNIKW